MSRTLRWTEHALVEFGSILEHLSVSSPAYADHLVQRVDQRLEQALTFPESGRVVPELKSAAVRELFELPYRIMYHVLPDVIEVVSVVHGRRDFHGVP